MIVPTLVPVIRRRYRCGCVTRHTGAAYLAEAEFYKEGLALHEELLYLRRRQRGMDLEHPCLPVAVAALEKKERAIDMHRRAAGLREEAVVVTG